MQQLPLSRQAVVSSVRSCALPTFLFAGWRESFAVALWSSGLVSWLAERLPAFRGNRKGLRTLRMRGGVSSVLDRLSLPLALSSSTPTRMLRARFSFLLFLYRLLYLLFSPIRGLLHLTQSFPLPLRAGAIV